MWPSTLRRSFSDFREVAVRERLSGENKRMLWIPAGFAHGFRVFSPKPRTYSIKRADYYAPQCERTWPGTIPISNRWELHGEPIISAKDQRGIFFRDAEIFD